MLNREQCFCHHPEALSPAAWSLGQLELVSRGKAQTFLRAIYTPSQVFKSLVSQSLSKLHLPHCKGTNALPENIWMLPESYKEWNGVGLIASIKSLSGDNKMPRYIFSANVAAQSLTWDIPLNHTNISVLVSRGCHNKTPGTMRLNIYLLTVVEAGKSRIKIPAGFGFGWDLSSWLRLGLSCCVLNWPFLRMDVEGARQKAFWCLFF